MEQQPKTGQIFQCNRFKDQNAYNREAKNWDQPILNINMGAF